MAQNLGNNRSIDQETDSGPPGGNLSGMGGASSNPDVQSRSAEWARQQGATALKEQQDQDLAQIGKVANIDNGGTSGFKT